MKSIAGVVFACALISGCSKAPEESTTTLAAPAVANPVAPTTAAPAGLAKRASAVGVVQSLDAVDHTVTIAHGPVEALGWPGMTMTFQAAGIDLASIKPGDKVAFEFTSTGVDGTIVLITKQ